MGVFILLFLFLGRFNIFVTAISKDACEQCTHKDNCSLFGNMTPDEQQDWVTRFPCPNPPIQTSNIVGNAPNAKDYVCCSNAILNTAQNNANNTNVNPGGGNIDPLISKPRQFRPEDPNANPANANPPGNLPGIIPQQPANPGRNTFTPINPGNINGQCAITNFPPDPNTGCCGLEATDTDRLIAGGTETELYQYPWTVLLKTAFNYGSTQEVFGCGGSLVSSRYVLSAGHCVFDPKGPIANVEVHLAEYNKKTFPLDCKMVIGAGQKCITNLIMYAENVIRHPQYDHNSLTNDISLIRLQGNAPYTDYIRPICLPPINIDEPQFSNLRLAAAGWGSNGQYTSDIKQSTVVNLVPQAECKKFYPALSKTQLCAAGYTGEDTCKGDSGGPLMTVYNGKYFVVGVVSGKRSDSPCGTSVPSLYTNVYLYSDWIRSNIRN